MKQKYLLVTLDFPPEPGGIQNYLYNFCGVVGAQNIAVLKTRAFNKGQMLPEIFNVYESGFLKKNKGKLFKLNVLFLLWKFFKINPRDFRLIFCGNIYAGAVGFFAYLLLGINYIVIAHGGEIKKMHHWDVFKPIKMIIIKYAKGFVSNSQYTKNLLVNLGIPADKILKILPATNLKIPEELKNDSMIEQRSIKVLKLLTIARLVPTKGVDIVIRSLKIVKDRGFQFKYDIIGDGPQRSELNQIVEDAGLQNRVVFCGPISEEKKTQYLAGCDLFILLSRETNFSVEGFGIVFIEAGIFGKPVIGSTIGGVSEAIVHRSTGLLVSPENIEEVANTIISLIKNDDLRIKMGHANRVRVEQEFRWEHRRPIIERLLQQT